MSSMWTDTNNMCERKWKEEGEENMTTVQENSSSVSSQAFAKKCRRKALLKKHAFIWTMLAGPIVCWFIFYLYTNLNMIVMAFQTPKGAWTWQNFVSFWDNLSATDGSLRIAVWNTFLYFLLANAVILPIGTLIAYFLYKKVPFYKGFRILFYLPSVLPGVVIATAPVAAEERIRLTEDFLGYVDNWATCDIFCNSWEFRKGESDLVWDYFSSLIDSGQEYRMRVSIIARMSLFKDEEHCRILLEDIATHDNPGYYYRMGAAWAVSMVYVDHPGIAEDLIRSGRMEAWTRNKSIQKIRESRRVPKEKKEELGALRRTAP